jgi:thiol-disulfide isomerase/thioredoxin
MSNMYQGLRARMVLLACLSGVLGPIPFPSFLHAQTGIPAPDINNKVWLNSTPQQLKDLRGKVVMVEFWTFGCYNCRNIEPYVKEWHTKYSDQGLVVIAIHSPEFSYEKPRESVQQYIDDHNILYAVPIDNDFETWRSYRNRFWPTLYLIDKQGLIQYVKIGEGGYAETDRQIQRLLAENESPSSSR